MRSVAPTGKAAVRIRAAHDASTQIADDDVVVTTVPEHRLCTLAATVGRSEACSGNACPFWEPGGAVLGGRCAFEQLGVTADAALASWLLEIRRRLEAANSAEEDRAIRSAFHDLLNGSAE